MLEILDHARALTDHRQHALIDEAMLETICKLVFGRRASGNARLFRVSGEQSELQVTLTTWSAGGQVSCGESECELLSLPRPMQEALEQQVITVESPIEHQRPHLHRTWLPITRGKELLACIELSTRHALTPRQLLLLDGVRGLYANYLSLLHYSEIDTLTRLLNRKTFDESLQRLLTHGPSQPPPPAPEHERRSTPMLQSCWLGVIDVDHFKRINDTYGHLFGDEVLILVANLLRKVFRRRDRLFRFGGEEFVVLVRETPDEAAPMAFERLREAIEQFNFPQIGQVTVSIGITRANLGDNPTSMLARADEALYYAKEHGRNRLANYEALLAEGEIQTHATVTHTEAELF